MKRPHAFLLDATIFDQSTHRKPTGLHSFSDFIAVHIFINSSLNSSGTYLF